MHKEIERRWLVSDKADVIDLKRRAEAIYEIDQGYLDVFSDMVLRVRILNQTKNRCGELEKTAVITFKSKPLVENAAARWEIEHPISVEDAKILLDKCGGHTIHKTRYNIKNRIDHKVFEFDFFKGRYKGLRIAECEYTEQDDPESNFVAVPEWCEEEITGQEEYSNYYLATAEPHTKRMKSNDFIDWQVEAFCGVVTYPNGEKRLLDNTFSNQLFVCSSRCDAEKIKMQMAEQKYQDISWLVLQEKDFERNRWLESVRRNVMIISVLLGFVGGSMLLAKLCFGM